MMRRRKYAAGLFGSIAFTLAVISVAVVAVVLTEAALRAKEHRLPPQGEIRLGVDTPSGRIVFRCTPQGQ